MAPRSTGSFTMGFSLASIAMKVYKAIETPGSETEMKQLCPTCKVPTQQKLVCGGTCGKEIAFTDLAKGVWAVDKFITFTTEEIASLKLAKSDKVDIIQFCAEDDIDSIYFEDGIYFLMPDKGHADAFNTFRDRLAGRYAVGDYTTGGKDHRVTISEFDNALVMRYLRPHKEVRSPLALPQYDKLGAGNPKHVKLMDMVIDSMSGPFDPTEIVDTYAANFAKLVEAKAGGTAFVPAVEVVEEKPSDTMAQLEASMALLAKAQKKTATVVPIKRKTAKKKAA
jgi:DNA end-binding protein Ku